MSKRVDVIQGMYPPSKKLRIALIHEIVPEEIMVLILKKLDYQTLICADEVCGKWSQIIVKYNLFNIENFSKLYKNNFKTLLFHSVIQILREMNFGESRNGFFPCMGALDFVDLVNHNVPKVQNS